MNPGAFRSRTHGKSELQGYVTAKGTIRFPLDEQLPLALIEKLVQARVRKNDEAEKKTPS